MTKTTEKAAPTSPPPVILVFGVDENDKPRAARFQGASPDLVAKAAQLMNLKVCEASSPELSELALERFRCFSILLGFPRRANSASPEPLMMEAKDGTGLQPGFA